MIDTGSTPPTRRIVVTDIMATDVEFIDADASVAEAAVMMGELDVGALPVGTALQADGIVTDRDILYRVVATGLDPTQCKLRDIWSQPVVACREEDSVQDAMDLMAANHIRHMPVENTDGRIVGWITLGDVSRHLLISNAAFQDALQEVTEAP